MSATTPHRPTGMPRGTQRRRRGVKPERHEVTLTQAASERFKAAVKASGMTKAKFAEQVIIAGLDALEAPEKGQGDADEQT